jgi:hypothetical protein
MSIRWRSAFRYPQTLFLVVGTVLGYLAMALFTGFRPLSLGVGAAIAASMLCAWFLQFRRDRISTTGNLLDRTVMREHLDAIAAQFPGIHESMVWSEAYQWASDSQQAAADIADQESTLMPDLLEALYTVEALVANVAGSVLALEQVQTEHYRTLTQQQLTKSRDRLRETHGQLQQLRDQMVLSQLSADAAASAALPERLQLLIDTNKTMLQAPTED